MHALHRSELSFETIDTTVDPQSRDFVISLGNLQAPMVCGSTHWSALHPNRIAHLTGAVCDCRTRTTPLVGAHHRV